jgi:hypothetical protein
VVVISLEQRRRGIGAVLLLRNHPAGEVVSCHCRQCDRAGQYRLAAPVERLRRQGPEWCPMLNGRATARPLGVVEPQLAQRP